MSEVINVKWPSKNLTNFTEYTAQGYTWNETDEDANPILTEDKYSQTFIIYNDPNSTQSVFTAKDFAIPIGGLEILQDEANQPYINPVSGFSSYLCEKYSSFSAPVYLNDVYVYDTIYLSDFLKKSYDSPESADLQISKTTTANLNNNMDFIYQNKSLPDGMIASDLSSYRLKLKFYSSKLGDDLSGAVYLNMGPNHIGLEHVFTGVEFTGIYYTYKKSGGDDAENYYKGGVIYINGMDVDINGSDAKLTVSRLCFSNGFEINNIYNTSLINNRYYKYKTDSNNIYLHYADIYKNPFAYISISNTGEIGGNGSIGLRTANILTIKLPGETYKYNNTEDIEIDLSTLTMESFSNAVSLNTLTNNKTYYMDTLRINIPQMNYPTNDTKYAEGYNYGFFVDTKVASNVNTLVQHAFGDKYGGQYVYERRCRGTDGTWTDWEQAVPIICNDALTDWDAAYITGTYTLPAGAKNAPTSDVAYAGTVIAANDGTTIQEVWPLCNMHTATQLNKYVRYYQTKDEYSKWTDWFVISYAINSDTQS